jgi:hypothetical protein
MLACLIRLLWYHAGVYSFSAGFLEKTALEKRAVSQSALEKRVDFRTALFLCPSKTAGLTVHVELCTKSTVISKGQGKS